MRLHNTSVPYYASSVISAPHGFFTCEGGVSEPPYASLNLSRHVGDRADRVASNRARALAALGLRSLVAVKQVHADRILTAEPVHLDAEPEGYDAIISTLPGTGLLIQQADCQAVLLAAPDHGVVAAIHCGWRGSVLDVVGATIRRLREQHGVPPDSLRAAISPSLGPCCAEFIHYRTELPTWMHAYQTHPLHFDFWAISRCQLITAGVRAEHIEVAGLCTRCSTDFFSYRRATHAADGVTGRNGSIIGLAE